jgi:plasmid stabilization system protein ParE
MPGDETISITLAPDTLRAVRESVEAGEDAAVDALLDGAVQAVQRQRREDAERLDATGARIRRFLDDPRPPLSLEVVTARIDALPAETVKVHGDAASLGRLRRASRDRPAADLPPAYDAGRDPTVAGRLLDRLIGRWARIGDAPRGGRPRRDLERRLRTAPFERSAVIAYRVHAGRVTITDVFCGGRDFEALYRTPSPDDEPAPRPASRRPDRGSSYPRPRAGRSRPPSLPA